MLDRQPGLRFRPSRDGLDLGLESRPLPGVFRLLGPDVKRLAVPLTSYLIGVAVGSGASPEEALRIVAGLVPDGEQ